MMALHFGFGFNDYTNHFWFKNKSELKDRMFTYWYICRFSGIVITCIQCDKALKLNSQKKDPQRNEKMVLKLPTFYCRVRALLSIT
jgi:hypothetical protein